MKIAKTLVGMFALASAATAVSAPVSALEWKSVTEDRLLNAAKDGNDWLIYGKDYGSTRYSPLDQINASNVGKLKPAYQIALGSLEGQAVTPSVNNGIMIVAVSSEFIDAYEVKTGNRLWRYEIKVPADTIQFACCGKLAKGVALFEDKVYALTLDARAIALNAKDGTLVWEKTLEDYKGGYTFTMAPTIIKGKLMAGFAGGEFGIVGQILALDPKTGNEVWKTSTIPQPGEEGYDTWGKDSAKYGGGAAWLSASYDPETNLTMWGTGNPAPWNSDMRPGDNLFSNSVIALDADTGKRKYYFQHVPNDAWDWDSMNENVFTEIDVGGKKTKVMLNAHKNGFMYTLDRTNGKFIRAAAFAPNIDWGTVDDKGKMQVKEGKRPGVNKDATFCPSYFGGKDWAHMAINPKTNVVFIPTEDLCVKLHHEETQYKKGTMYLGAGGEIAVPGTGALVAFDANANKVIWAAPNPSPLQSGSALATGGGLAFVGTLEGNLKAYDQKTGKELFSYKTPSGIIGGVITFSDGGKQYVAVVSGYGGAFPLWAGKGVPDHIKNNVNKGAVLNVFELGS
ncbi:MAG: PQQ-dependent dehydrogenase, methanol/ethanol family [Hyphomicrobium sp.]